MTTEPKIQATELPEPASADSEELEDAAPLGEVTGPVVFVVATPIGNLDDVSPRMRKTLANVDVIAAEDTRNTRRLLNHLGISGKRLISYHDHNESVRAAALVAELLVSRESLALVSDAGTPCISDPGYRLVAAAKAAGIKVHPIPGPSAPTTLVCASGLASDRVLFLGFLPPKAQAFAAEVASWRSLRASIVFFEATRRLERTLLAIQDVYPQARVAVGRELTKLFEEIETQSIADAVIWARSHPSLKGEATVMIEIGEAHASDSASHLSRDDLIAAAARDFKGGATLKDLLQKYRDSGYRRPELYDLLLDARKV